MFVRLQALSGCAFAAFISCREGDCSGCPLRQFISLSAQLRPLSSEIPFMLVSPKKVFFCYKLHPPITITIIITNIIMQIATEKSTPK